MKRLTRVLLWALCAVLVAAPGISQVITGVGGGPAGGAVGGTGTAGTLAKFSAAQTLANSIASESGTVLTVANTVNAVTGFQVNGSALNISNIAGLGANCATWLATPSSANLAACMPDETGSGLLVFNNAPTFIAPVLGAATATSLQGIIGNVTPAAFTGTTVTIAASANTVPLNSTGYSVTGSGTSSHTSVTGTLSTSGIVMVNDWSITNTASDGSSRVLRIRAGAAGVTDVFNIDLTGVVRLFGNMEAGGVQFRNTGSIFPQSDNAANFGTDANRYSTGFFSRLKIASGTTALTLTDGALGMSKMTASASAPGAAGAKFEVVCGTNAGSAKLVMYAGTSGTAVAVIDNVGAGVTGC